MEPPPWPPDIPPFADLVRDHTRLIHLTARRWGVREVDVRDVAQEVLLRLYRAIVARRLDAKRPIGGWLITTTRRLARDHLNLARNQNEVLTTTGALDLVQDVLDHEECMAEALDAPGIIDQILPRIPPKPRAVFIMSDLEHTSLDDIARELQIHPSTAHDRLQAGRKAFAQEWEALRKSGDVNVAPFAHLEVRALIAADVLMGPPPAFTEDLLGRLGEELGVDFTGPASGTAVAGTLAQGSAAAGVAMAGTVTMATWQLGLIALVAGLAGAGIHASLRPGPPAREPLVTVAFHDPSPVTTASPSALAAVESATLAPPEAPASGTSSAPAVSESQARLVESARKLLRDHESAKALVLLARVTAPELVAEREKLRGRALAEQAGAGRP